MLRAAFICIFLSLYILIVGPPLLVYTAITKNVDPLYWASIKGIMFFVNCVGVRVHVKGLERIPAETCIFAANSHQFSRRACRGLGHPAPHCDPY